MINKKLNTYNIINSFSVKFSIMVGEDLSFNVKITLKQCGFDTKIVVVIGDDFQSQDKKSGENRELMWR